MPNRLCATDRVVGAELFCPRSLGPTGSKTFADRFDMRRDWTGCGHHTTRTEVGVCYVAACLRSNRKQMVFQAVDR
jgi:hypothetical protein